METQSPGVTCPNRDVLLLFENFCLGDNFQTLKSVTAQNIEILSLAKEAKFPKS